MNANVSPLRHLYILAYCEDVVVAGGFISWKREVNTIIDEVRWWQRVRWVSGTVSVEIGIICFHGKPTVIVQ